VGVKISTSTPFLYIQWQYNFETLFE